MERKFIKKNDTRKVPSLKRGISLAVVLGLVFSFSLFAQSPSSRQIARPKGTTACAYGYYEYLPSNYNAVDKLPLVVFYHGVGEAGNGTSDLSRVLKNGPPAMVVNENKDFPFILISPQTDNGFVYGSGVDNVIQHAKKNYKVDPDRIYVTGLSAGGFNAWVAGQDLNATVAAIVPICGCGDSKKAANMKNLPIWAFHNSGDPTVATSCTTIMVDAVKNVGGNPKLTIYQSNSHDAWTATYHDQNMWDWLLSQKKGSTTAPAPPANKAPTANAGQDITITLPTNSTSISGSASDKDGSISSYSWTKQSGGNATLTNTSTTTLSVADLVEGSYTFRLTVKDNQNAAAYDEVNITVRAAPSTNHAPVLVTLDNKTLSAGTSLNVNVSATDSDDDAITLSASGLPSFATFTDNNNGTATIALSPVAGNGGSSNITIAASDGKGGSDSETFTVTVEEVASPAPPTPSKPVQTVLYRINCGGEEIKDSPINWVADMGSTPAKYLSNPSSSSVSIGGCWWPNHTNNTGGPYCLFGSFRYDWNSQGIKYAFPVSNGDFIVNLFFAEKDNSGSSGVQKKGNHVFDVYAENNLLIDNLDLFEENGYNAVKKTINVTVTDNVLNLNLKNVKNYPTINGIEIIGVTDGSASKFASYEGTTTHDLGTVKMFPNPISENELVVLEFEKPIKGRVNMSIIDGFGKTHHLQEENLKQATLTLTMDVSKAHLTPGLYFVNIKNELNNKKVLKLIKK